MLISPASGFHGSGFRTVLGPIASEADVDRSSYTYVAKYLPGALKATGSTVRLVIQGTVASGHVGTVSDVYIGLVSTAAGANAYDFDGNQVRVTFGGLNPVSLTTGSLRTSDEIAFVVDGSKAMLIAYNLAASTFISYKSGLGTNYVLYSKPAINQAATTSKATGYLPGGGFSTLLLNLECA